jgi:hypothetical protein
MTRSEGPSKSELLKGTLDMLILQTLTLQSLHGYAIAQHIERLSDDVDEGNSARRSRASTACWSPSTTSCARREHGACRSSTDSATSCAYSLFDAIAQDARFALRTFRRSPTLTAVAVLTLAIGIGANTAIFSAVDALLLRPLPFPNPEQLMQVSLTVPARGTDPARRAASVDPSEALREG